MANYTQELIDHEARKDKRRGEAMKAWTDYPIEQLGDAHGKKAPVRQCEVLDYDGDKYCHILVEGVLEHLKICYVYQEAGRCGEVPPLTQRQRNKLPRTDYASITRDGNG